MEILIADRETPSAAAVARTLEDHGHIVRTCRDAETSGGLPCAALRGEDCPLDVDRIDVVVSVGPDLVVDHLGDGDLCAIRRRVPLVLLDRAHETLGHWAAAMAPASRVLEAVDAVRAAILPSHSTRARQTVAAELRQQGLDEKAVDVEVTRRNGGLVVDLFVDDRVSAQEAQALTIHVMQTVRLFDPWAKSIDASIHRAAE
jgi:hypothetical protein